MNPLLLVMQKLIPPLNGDQFEWELKAYFNDLDMISWDELGDPEWVQVSELSNRMNCRCWLLKREDKGKARQTELEFSLGHLSLRWLSNPREPSKYIIQYVSLGLRDVVWVEHVNTELAQDHTASEQWWGTGTHPSDHIHASFSKTCKNQGNGNLCFMPRIPQSLSLYKKLLK